MEKTTDHQIFSIYSEAYFYFPSHLEEKIPVFRQDRNIINFMEPTSTNTSQPELRSLDIPSGEEVRLASDSPKKPAGRKKFTETRHQVYRGIRSKSSGKWVCEIREPVRQARIWLGTYPTAEMAARAYDVAAIALRGNSACVNFADSVSRMRIPDSTDPKAVQKAAAEGAEAFRQPECETERYDPSPLDLTLGDESNNEKTEECSSSYTNEAMNNKTGDSEAPFWSAFEDGLYDMEDCFVSDEPEVYSDMSLWDD